MTTLDERIAHLPNVDGFKQMKLFGETGGAEAVLDNMPGTHASFRIYYHVAIRWGGIGPKAAHEALELYGELAGEAEREPGKHPNIDRLFDVIARDIYYSVRCYPV